MGGGKESAAKAALFLPALRHLAWLGRESVEDLVGSGLGSIKGSIRTLQWTVNGALMVLNSGTRGIVEG